MSLFDILFPKKCVSCGKFDDYLCPSCFAKLSFDVPERCLVCGKSAMYGLTHPVCRNKYTIDGAFCGVVYAKSMRKLIANLKYAPYVHKVSFLLSELVYESISQNESFLEVLQMQPMLIPIPLSQTKMKKRGYNQAHILAKEIGKKLGLPVIDFLKRTKDTKPQFGLTKAERFNNVKNAFEINSAFKTIQNSQEDLILKIEDLKINKSLIVNHKSFNVLLVDDILTTGATVMEAAKILKQNGANHVWALSAAAD